MASFSRRLAGLDAVRTAAGALVLCIVLGLAAYGFASYYTPPSLDSLVAAVAALAVAGAGLLYAFRPGTGGLGD